MKRREFLKSSSLAAVGAGSLASTVTASAADKSDGPREFYELRLYHLKPEKAELFHNFYRKAAIPAMNRIGINPVGVFTALTPEGNPTMYVLMPHKSLELFATSNDRTRADAEYQKAGAEFINLPATDPAYIRVESSLMVAFETMPKIEVPASAAGNKPRIFELRTYESHSKKANKKKIEMFNTGEIAIFRRVGLQPVFFGETMIGTKLPNLTYMLTFEDMPAHDKNWRAFGSDAEWKKLSKTPGFTDPEIVSNITRTFLRPTDYSQI